jgi:hypothetical protein
MAPPPARGKAHIAPTEVHELLEKHILADGLPMVLDRVATNSAISRV